MKFMEHTAASFAEVLASPAPVPGGGARALAGAISIAPGDMAGELTVGKKKFRRQCCLRL